MITKVTKENKALYQALFDEASIRLNENADPGADEIIITSLDDYFCSLSDLLYRQEDIDELNYRFAILPLDEPLFEIDANTRVITVPSEFKKNGISVKGDQIAETLYFSVDRYYDTIDLAGEDVQIYIQCELPGADQHLYRAVHKDITILRNQGKMIFGWTIDNIATSISGTLKFSVRFVRSQANSQTGKDEIVFSLSTLTANVTINPGLDFTFVDGEPSLDVIDNLSIIKNRVKDSIYYDTDVVAPTPEFIINIPADAFDQVVEGDITYLLADLEGGQYQLIAQATSDEGIISYEWRRADLANGIAGEVINGSDIYVKSTDTEWSTDYLYYVKESENVYTVFDTTGLDPEDEELPELYIKRNGVTVGSVGNYWVIAKNRKGIALSSATSNYVRIPGPGVLSVEVDDLELDGNGNYQVILDQEGRFTLEATGLTDRFDNDLGIGDKITYTWSEEDQTDPIIAEAVNHIGDNGESDTFTLEDPVTNRESFDHIITLQVAASRNGAATSSADVEANTKKFRITDSAQVPKVSAHEREVTLDATGHATLSVDVDVQGIVSDELTYQWYKIIADEQGAEDPGANDMLISGATGDTIVVDSAFRFYCLVTNHVNGSSATSKVPNPAVAADRDLFTTVSNG